MTDPTLAAPSPLRVLVVDADDRIRESLARLLPIGGRCLCVGSAGDVATALRLVASISPEVVMIDGRFPSEAPNTSLIDSFRAACPDARIVVLNWTDADRLAPRLAGADAYIKKTFRPHELIDAVVNAARTPVA